MGGPGGGHLDGRGTGGGRQGDQVEDVRDGGHQAVHRGHQAHQQTRNLNQNINIIGCLLDEKPTKLYVVMGKTQEPCVFEYGG